MTRSQQLAFNKYRTPSTLENTGYGTLRLQYSNVSRSVWTELQSMLSFLTFFPEVHTVSYCCWGFPYRKTTALYSQLLTWIPDGHGTGGKCSHSSHEQVKTSSEAPVSVSGYTSHAAVCRYPPDMLDELVTAAILYRNQTIPKNKRVKLSRTVSL
jgi:hypothetical protein